MNDMTGGLTFEDIRELRKQGDLGKFIKQGMAAARVECERRRALVLAYPDLAARLCDEPIGYSHPEVWTGFIPPAVWSQTANNSPMRPALLALVEEAEARASKPKGLAA